MLALPWSAGRWESDPDRRDRAAIPPTADPADHEQDRPRNLAANSAHGVRVRTVEQPRQERAVISAVRLAYRLLRCRDLGTLVLLRSERFEVTFLMREMVEQNRGEAVYGLPCRRGIG